MRRRRHDRRDRGIDVAGAFQRVSQQVRLPCQVGCCGPVLQSAPAAGAELRKLRGDSFGTGVQPLKRTAQDDAAALTGRRDQDALARQRTGHADGSSVLRRA